MYFAGHARFVLIFQNAARAHYTLVSSLDGLTLLRRDLAGLLDAADAEDGLWKALGAGGTLRDLPSHAIIDRGRIVGLWEFDPEKQEIVWATLIKPNAAAEGGGKTHGGLLRKELRDARSFSLDSPKSRAPAWRPCENGWRSLPIHQSLRVLKR